MTRIGQFLKWVLPSIVVADVALLAFRRALSGPPSQPWHSFVPIN